MRPSSQAAPRIVAHAERPDLAERDWGFGDVWPEFMHHDTVVNRTWGELRSRFPTFQLWLVVGDAPIGMALTIPFAWDGDSATLPEGVDGVSEAGIALHAAGGTPTALSALVAVVLPEHRGRGLAAMLVEGMRTTAAEHGLPDLVAPIRPTLKERYPLAPFESYVRWRRADGRAFDPWQRLHERLGGEVLRTAERSLVVTGTVGEWEKWTGLAFPESGPYVVDGALVPVEVDVARDIGRYEEPNLWMRHRASSNRSMPRRR
jgi:GNAT superfamily N-acetyltransferase